RDRGDPFPADSSTCRPRANPEEGACLPGFPATARTGQSAVPVGRPNIMSTGWPPAAREPRADAAGSAALRTTSRRLDSSTVPDLRIEIGIQHVDAEVAENEQRRQQQNGS